MKILYIITKSNWGGAQRHVFDLATHAKKNGQDVVVALGGEGMLRDRLREAGIPTRSIQEMWRDINVSKDASSLWKIFKIIREEKPDILHLHSPKAAGLGSFSGRLLGIKKIIYTVHGFAFNEERPLYQKFFISFFSWLTMLFSTHVITLYEKETKQAKRFPWVSHKVRMIYPGIAAPTFFAASSAQHVLQARTTISFAKKVLIGTIAELHPNKGFTYMFDALEGLISLNPSFVFFVIGDGDQRAELEALIIKKKLENHVVLAGQIPNAAEYLKAFSIFLLPSVKEGLPYVLLEAGYAGLSVIATTVGGIPEVIEDMHSGVLIQPKKSGEILHSLQFLIEHKNIQREHARNLQEKVRAKFNIERMLTSTMKVYAEAPSSSKHQ